MVALFLREIGLQVSLEKCIGIGFDATCSLVVLNKQGEPHRLKTDSDSNIVMWMDHRAKQETQGINATQHPCLRFVGNSLSVEAQPGKLLWLKERQGEEWWKGVGHFLDLPDFLTFAATGSLRRSQCSLVCKWLYQASETHSGWDDSFWRAISLSHLPDQDYASVGTDVVVPGAEVGRVHAAAARELGVAVGTRVAGSIIDAHAGVLGALASLPKSVKPAGMLVMIGGTSTCHMALSDAPAFIPGVWGPYLNVLGLPGVWLNEMGQSAVGSVLDQLILAHSQGPKSALFPNAATLPDCHRQLIQYIQEALSKRSQPFLFLKQQFSFSSSLWSWQRRCTSGRTITATDLRWQMRDSVVQFWV